MARRDDYNIVETIISSLKETDPQTSIEGLSKKTKIRTNSLKKWLKIIELIQNSSMSITLIENKISIHGYSGNISKIRTRIQKREEDPNIQEFLNEFKGVLSKTKLSIEDENRKNYPQLKTRSSCPSNLSPEYTDLHSELTQVLEQGLSFLSSSEPVNEGENSQTEVGFMQELKQAVNLGIENLEKVVATDYKEKKGRVTEMKSELELAFKAREERMNEGSKT
ncbi:MAG: hypothetical protein ACXAAT_07895 [Candidatus Hodarchaeales archaeon]|jgi:hypothetical protein